MEELIREKMQQEAKRRRNHSVPWDSIRDRILSDNLPAVPFRTNTLKCKIGYSLTAVVVIGGLLLMSGFISPAMARTLERIPVVKAVFNYFGDAGLQNAINKGLGTTANRTATDNGISVTITDVIYDRGRLAIGYTVTAARPLGNELPLQSIILGPPGMQFFINGKAVHDTEQGTEQKMANGNVGLVEIYSRGNLPETFNLQIVIHQIGEQKGEWLFSIPVSRRYSDAVTKVFWPMKAETVGQTTVIGSKVEIAPSSTVVEYELIQPVQGRYDWINLPVPVDDRGHFLPGITCYVTSKHIEGDMKMEVIRALFESSKRMPKYLVFTPPGPGSIGYPEKKLKFFLN